MNDTGRPTLRLLRGGLDRRTRSGVVRVTTEAPVDIEAVVEEEDTYLVLSTPAELRDPGEHPIRLMTAVLDARGVEPGSVVVREGRPLRMLAAVHDLSADPTWREPWVEMALEEIFHQARRRRLRSLALPLLATRHGKLKPERFMVLLRRAIVRHLPDTLDRVWLVAPPEAGYTETLMTQLSQSPNPKTR